MLKGRMNFATDATPLHLTQPSAATAVDSVRMLQTLLANLEGMFYRSRNDEHWTMEFLSEGCQRLTGYKPEDLLLNRRISYEEIMHPQDRRRVRHTIQAALAANTFYELEYRLVRADGAVRWVSERGVGLFDCAGVLTSMEGIIYDVTNRKLAEVASRETERRYQSLFDNALYGIFRTSIDGHYLDANPALARIYGFASPRELIVELADIRTQLYVLPTRREEFMAQIRRHGTVSGFESQVYRRDGQVIWIAETARAVLDEDGNVTCYEGMVEDISERKRQHESLMAARLAAESATRAKSEFLANMSHEIRTPMNGVIGMTTLLLDTPLNATQRECAVVVRDSARELLTVINDILDFSKIEAGKLQLELREVQLRETLEGVVRLLAMDAGGKGLQIDVRIDPTLPAFVKGDDGRIRQILLNLGGNAVKFTATGSVSFALDVLEQSGDSSVVRIAVTDTGIGIPADRIGALFTPFTQVDSSTTRQFGGTGLGLSISHRLVELMGGAIGVESTPGAGSTFWFTVRFEHACAPAASLLPGILEQMATQDGSSHVAAAASVLLVEDNVVNQKVAARLLQKYGCRVDITADGRSAIEKWRIGDYDLIFMDCQMPELDGYAATREIRRLEQGARRIPIVALTAHAMKGDDRVCFEAGMDDYLSKPLDSAKLRACLARHLPRSVQKPSRPT